MSLKKIQHLALSMLLMSCGNVFAHETAWQTFGKDLISPVTTPAKWVLLSGALATTVVFLAREGVDTPFQDYMSSNKPLGRWAHVGDLGGQGYLNLAYFAGMLGVSHIWPSEVSQNRAMLMLKSSAYTGGVTTILKGAVRAPRPNNRNERNSWPSGHTSMAFSFASVVGAEHEWYWGLAAYSLATLTAASRLNDDRHFLRDVIAGATIGASYGLGLYYRRREPSTSSAKVGRSTFDYVASFLPTDDLNGATLVVAASF